MGLRMAHEDGQRHDVLGDPLGAELCDPAPRRLHIEPQVGNIVMARVVSSQDSEPSGALKRPLESWISERTTSESFWNLNNGV